MKATLIYGSDTAAAFKRFEHIIKSISSRGWEIINIQKDQKTLAEKMRSTSLFIDQRLFVLEKADILTDKDLVWLKNNKDFEANFLIYTTGKVPLKLKNSLGKNLKIEKFDLPVKIFQFLDSIYPSNAKNCIRLFGEVVSTEPPEMILAMMATTLRDLYWIKLDPKTYSTSAWRASKLKAQADKFKANQLKNFIDKLAKIDIKTKTSDANLARELDLLLATHLQ